MKLYRIADWEELYENSRSRRVEDLAWVPMPNRHDGEHYTEIVMHPEGAKIFAAFVLMVQVASTCDPRGVLLRGNGTPHTPSSLCLKTRAPQEWFEVALEYLITNTDWLDYSEVTPEYQSSITGLPSGWDPCGEGKKGKNGKKEGELFFVFPLHFGNRFKAEWDQWLEYRKSFKAPKVGWQKLFDSQLEWLLKFDEATAVDVIATSRRNGWQGIFEPKRKSVQPKPYVPNI